MAKRKRFINIEEAMQNKLFMRIISVILAVVIWAVFSLTLYPTIYKTISNIPVTVDLNGTKAERQGLSVVSVGTKRVSATIHGMRYEIGNLSSSELTAAVDTSKISEPGEYDLNLKINSKDDDDFTVENITPSKVTVKFDYIQTVELDIEVEAPNVSADEGFTLTQAEVSPSKISISGPRDEVEKITSAKAVYNKKHTLSESFSTKADSIVFYNEEKVMDQSNLTVDQNQFTIEFSIYKKKTLPFEIEIQGAPASFDVSSVRYTFSTDTIDILSPNSNIDNMTSKHLGYLQLKDIYPGAKFEMPVTLDAGQINVSGIDSVTVKIDKSGYGQKTVSLSKSNINVINKADDNKVSVKTQRISNVRLYGPDELISNITSDDIIAELDFNGESLKEGSYTRQVRIYSPNNDKIWAYGSYDVSVEVKKK